MKKPKLPKPKPVEKQAVTQASAEDQALQQRRRQDQLDIAKGLAGPRALLGGSYTGFGRKLLS